MQQAYTLTTVTGATEVSIGNGTPVRVISVIPQGAAAGTATLREATAIGGGGAARWVASSTGTMFTSGDAGVTFAGGLTVQLSNGADTFGIVWGPRQ